MTLKLDPYNFPLDFQPRNEIKRGFLVIHLFRWFFRGCGVRPSWADSDLDFGDRRGRLYLYRFGRYAPRNKAQLYSQGRKSSSTFCRHGFFILLFLNFVTWSASVTEKIQNYPFLEKCLMDFHENQDAKCLFLIFFQLRISKARK